MRASTAGADRRRGPRAEPRLCFAFGSNLDPAQMERRAPGCFEVVAATLLDHDLDFVGWSRTWGGGVATVTPRRRRRVAGVLYALTDAHVAELDRFEGAPFVYRRETVSVIVHGSGVAVRAELYRHTDTRRAAPSGRYLAAITGGLRARGLPLDHVEAAARRAAEEERAPLYELLRRGWPHELVGLAS